MLVCAKAETFSSLLAGYNTRWGLQVAQQVITDEVFPNLKLVVLFLGE